MLRGAIGEVLIIFLYRYKVLCPRIIGKEKMNEEVMCDFLCKALEKMKFLTPGGWQKGKTKIFLKDSQVFYKLCCCFRVLRRTAKFFGGF